MGLDIATQDAPAAPPSAAVDSFTAPVDTAATPGDSLASRLQIVTRMLTGGGTDTYAAPGLSATPTSKAPTATAAPGAPGYHTYEAATGDMAQFQSYAASKLADFGWDATQMPYLIDLWNRESGWRPDAQNPNSTAYGIAQFLDTTWGGYGKKTPDPYAQMDAGLKYIAARYGSPSAAIDFWNKHRWY